MSKISMMDMEEFIVGGKASTRTFDLYKTTADGEVKKLPVTVRPITIYELTKLTNKALLNVDDIKLRDKFTKMLDGDEKAVKDVSDNDMIMFNFYFYALYGAYAIQDSFDADIDEIVDLILSCDANCIMELREFVAQISGVANSSTEDVEAFHEDESR